MFILCFKSNWVLFSNVYFDNGCAVVVNFSVFAVERKENFPVGDNAFHLSARIEIRGNSFSAVIPHDF